MKRAPVIGGWRWLWRLQIATLGLFVGATSGGLAQPTLLKPETFRHYVEAFNRSDRETVTILFDKTGERYGRGKGLRVLVDGRSIAGRDSLQRVTETLP